MGSNQLSQLDPLLLLMLDPPGRPETHHTPSHPWAFAQAVPLSRGPSPQMLTKQPLTLPCGPKALCGVAPGPLALLLGSNHTGLLSALRTLPVLSRL